MTKESISADAFKKIKAEEIKPRPRWQFTMRNAAYVALFSFFVMVISVCASVLIFMLVNNDWDLLTSIDQGFLGFVFITFPYLWLGLFGIFMVMAYIIFRKLRGSYRFKIQHVLFAFMIVGILSGSLFYYIGLGKTVELGLRDHVPLYRQAMKHQEKPFMNPEQGVLSGRVVEIISREEIVIIDPNNNEWHIFVVNGIESSYGLEVQLNLPVILQGDKIDDNTFKATLIKTSQKGRFMLIQKDNKTYYYKVKEI